MDSETINLTSLICDTLNSIFVKLFSSIDNTVFSHLDDILFINSDIIHDTKFQKLFGTDATNGLLLIANSLIFGILLFYIFKFVVSHLTYSNVDSPYQFIFKCIIFATCMNSSLWLCEKLIDFTTLLCNCIGEIGNSVTGYEINLSYLINHIHSILYPSFQTFDLFSFEGILQLLSIFGYFYIFITSSVCYILCKILVLIAPFAWISLIHHQFEGFFKGWLKQFLILLFRQILITLILVIGFSLEFFTGNILSQISYFAIILVIAKCNFYVKEMFHHIYKYHHNKLKDFI